MFQALRSALVGCLVPLSLACSRGGTKSSSDRIASASSTRAAASSPRAENASDIRPATEAVPVSALGLLRRTQDTATGLHERVEAYNLTHPAPDGMQKLVFYAGQAVLGLEEEGTDE